MWINLFIKITSGKKFKANVGISFDGDADRIIMVDEMEKLLMEIKLLPCLQEDGKQKNFKG